MANKKGTKTFYFSVEGETEEWYLGWLQEQINKSDEASFNVSLNYKKSNPKKRAKNLTIRGKTTIYHLADYESSEPMHINNFMNLIDSMKEAMENKQFTYRFGYSNLTFDLWIILHRCDCFGQQTHRNHYLPYINKAFADVIKRPYESMKEYKEEKNFKQILAALTLEDIKDAIKRAKRIQDTNEQNRYQLQEYKGFKYYRENPSLELGTIFGYILKECGIHIE